MMNFTQKVAAASFGLDSNGWILGFVPGSIKAPASVPELDPDHVFDPIAFESIRMWWEAADTRQPLYISGPTGCGKTTTVMQLLARVNMPAVAITCRRRMDKQDLIGHFGATEKGLSWIDGPATIAWRYGLTLVINEFSTAPGETWVSCNDILEGADLRIDATGEVVPRHPNTRVIITDNCACADAGDSDVYVGRERQDASVADRFWHLAMDYVPREIEGEILWNKTRKSAQGLTDEEVESVIAQALDFVALTRSLANKSDAASFEATPLPAVSSRVVVRFLSILFGLIKSRKTMGKEAARLVLGNIVEKALDLAFTKALPEGHRGTLQQSAAYTMTQI